MAIRSWRTSSSAAVYSVPRYLNRLLAGWLIGSGRTDPLRSTCGRALADWFSYCAAVGLDTVATQPAHVEEWARVALDQGASLDVVQPKAAAVSSWNLWLRGPEPSWALPPQEWPEEWRDLSYRFEPSTASAT
jgi:hypothetical protein